MQINPSFSYEHVSLLINLIVQTYHYDATSVCILWNDDFPFNLRQPNVDNYAAVASLYKTAFIEDVEIPASRLDLLTKFDHKLIESINHTHCESFIAFEKEITMFVNSFMKSVLHSKWRSLKNKFLFIYTKDQVDVAEWNDVFFKDLNNILFVEMINETLFNLKTTKFVGSRNNQPEELILLDRYHGETKTFEFNQSLYPDKLRDLQGREVIAAAFAYEPFTVLKKNVADTNVMDVAHGNKDPSKRVLYDGTDAQALFHLCGLYNCTVQVDSSEEEEWGYVYDNLSSNGALGLVFERKADITLMAMYMWRVASWLLPLKPFHWFLWLGIAGCLCFEAIGLLVTSWADGTANVSWTESAYFGYVTSLKLFVSQSCNYLPSSFSVRIVLFSCYMIDIIITSVCSGGLASILTIPTLEEVADSFERLARHNQIWVGTMPNWVFSINGSEDVVANNMNINLQRQVQASLKTNFDEFGPIKLDIANFAGILSVLIMGIGLSVLAFIGEIMPEVYAFLDMSVITSRSGITCLVPAPSRTTSWFLPFEPFQVNLWLSLGGCFILEILGLLITRKMETGTKNTWAKSFQFGYISTFKLFLSQSTRYVVNASSVRIVLFSCYMIDIIITSIYGGGLASILTIPTWEEAPDNIDRMIKQNLIWGATSLAWIITLQNTQNEKIRQIVNLNRIYSPEELRIKSLTERIGIALERVQFGHFAMPGYIEQAAVDRMKIMIEDITYEYCVTYATPAWALMEKFNNFCMMVQSGGLLKYWEWLVVAKHLDTKMQNQVEASAYVNFGEGGPVALGAKNFAGIMVLWVGGCVFSTLAFIGEVALNWWMADMNLQSMMQ